jgi:3-phenylpropionate/trans-cinnamate dioxygenase ferredoxin reductase component
MKRYKYLIIGGGMTGSAAVKGIRTNDPEGSIAMLSKEAYEPYDRPPLSKGLWNNSDIESIQRPMDEFSIDLFLETTVEKLFPDRNQIRTKAGEDYQYEKLLLATGGDPTRFPGAPEDVIYYRTRDDYHRLQTLTNEKDNFCIIGGGFIGSELAAALNKNNKDVTLIFPEAGISGMFFPDDLASFLVDYYQKKGVNVLQSCLVDSITQQAESYRITYHTVGNNNRSELQCDGVIAGIGIKPNIDLARDAGLTVDDGIVVNEFLQTNHPNIYAAGDVANFFNFGLGKRTRVEHEDNANAMGKTAGLNMSGELEQYDHFPMFYSDLFDLGYEAVGEFNKDFEIVGDWIEPFKKGTIFYLQDDIIKGLIFWNLWGKVDEGKAVIQAGKPVNRADLKGMFTE